VAGTSGPLVGLGHPIAASTVWKIVGPLAKTPLGSVAGTRPPSPPGSTPNPSSLFVPVLAARSRNWQKAIIVVGARRKIRVAGRAGR
jgi:hypothetical protein